MLENYKGFTIEIEPDEIPESPREWSNLGKMACFHKSYNLGDETCYGSDSYNSWEEMANDIIKAEKTVFIAPLYLYDHSGLRIKIGSFYGLLSQGHAEFDSGQIGFIYATAEDVKKEYNVKRITKTIKEKVKRVLENEVKIYDQYLSGDVYQFIIKDKEEEMIDSCGGFYGYDDCLKEAQSIIDNEIKNRLEAKVKQTKKYIKGNIPLIYRKPCVLN